MGEVEIQTESDRDGRESKTRRFQEQTDAPGF